MDQGTWVSSCNSRAHLLYSGGQGQGLWAILGERAQYLSMKICYSFLGWDICYLSLWLWNWNVRSEKYIRIFSNGQAALKALQAIKTMSPLVWQCWSVLNDISAQHSVRLGPQKFWDMWKWNCWWVHKRGSCLPVCWTRASPGMSRQNIKKTVKCWLVNQHDVVTRS